MHYIPVFSTIITFAFAVAVFNRYRYKKGNHLLMWGIGLILYGLGTLTEVILGLTFSPLALKVWYLSGAMLTAAWLGQGTIFLLIRRRGVAPALTALLALVSLLAIYLLLAAPITQAAASYDVAKPVSMQYREILTRGGLVILLTILLNIYGTIALVGGAAYSAYLFWRKRVLASRVLGNILIALGALMPAMAGSLVKAGLADWLYVSELLGAVIMYIGFIQSTAGKPVEQTVAAPSQASVVK
ncbi:MAG TPA: hypothetical protein VF823_12090 [Anaerolineales bacterium]